MERFKEEKIRAWNEPRPAQRNDAGKIPLNFGGLAVMVTGVTLDPRLCVAGFRRVCAIGCFSTSILLPSSADIRCTFIISTYRFDSCGGTHPERPAGLA
jgi:hypothetical protein